MMRPLSLLHKQTIAMRESEPQLLSAVARIKETTATNNRHRRLLFVTIESISSESVHIDV